MSGSVEIVLWLQEYKLQALEAQLARDGFSTEKLLQDMLDDLYHRRVPLDIQREISERLDAEAAAELAERDGPGGAPQSVSGRDGWTRAGAADVDARGRPVWPAARPCVPFSRARQAPCPSRAVYPRSGPVQARDPWTKKRQAESPDAFLRPGPHFCPQCGQFPDSCTDAFLLPHNGG